MKATLPAAGLACVIAAAALSAQTPSADSSAIIRRFPYPFTHMVSMASDVDTQAPWHGAAIHRVINEQIALPISDSLWVQGQSVGASALFLGGDDLNERPSEVGTHTTFGLLLREWHRGNIDTFHSWQDDSVPPLQQQLRAPLRLASAVTTIPMVAPPEALTGLMYRHLRLYFNAPPPDDLWLRLHATLGRTVVVTAGQARAGLAVNADPRKPPYRIEIVTGVAPDQGVTVEPEQFNLALLEKVELHARSCEKGCPVTVTRIDRDAFSRRAVLLQLPTLAAFNIRPAMVSSHGGFSYAQNFDAENYSATMPRTPGSAYESMLVPNVLRNQGSDPRSHAYHADLLRDFGVNTIWSFSKTSKHNWNVPLPRRAALVPGFHDLVRTTVDYKSTTLDEFRQELPRLEPGLKGVMLDDIFCAKVCWGDQGSMIGLLAALSLARIDAGKPADHLWYTHFGSGDSDFKRSAHTPLRPSAVAWLERLSNRMFNFDRSVIPARRVWVAPSGSVARYRIAHSQIGRHVSVDPRTSRVTIATWQDPVTNRVTPDLAAGMRDLHGITVYVPDAAAATVAVSGKNTTSFTRNPPDESGRPSVTLVDDSTPTPILDDMPLAANGAVRVTGGSWSEPARPREGAARGQTFGVVTASGGDAVVRWQPGRLALWNISHLETSLRRIAAGASTGRAFLELEMTDGGVIAAIEAPTATELANKSAWAIGRDPIAQQWSRRVLSVAELQWPATHTGRRPPLPIGMVREVRFGLRGAAPGERLELDSIRALRPNSNNVAPDGGKLAGGQVVLRGKVQPGVVIEARRRDGYRLTTVTDRNGYYFFVRQPANEVLEIAALSGRRRCAPLGGSMVQLTRDEPELDIDLGSCR